MKPAASITILTNRERSGMFTASHGKAFVTSTSSTHAARALAAELLGVEPAAVDLEPIGQGMLHASARPRSALPRDRQQLLWWIEITVMLTLGAAAIWFALTGGLR